MARRLVGIIRAWGLRDGVRLWRIDRKTRRVYGQSIFQQLPKQ